jgi:hypothetical protein
MRHYSSAESRAKLEMLLQRLFVLVVGGVLDDDSIITFADLSALLRLGLRLPLFLFLQPWGEGDTEMYFFRSFNKIKQA